MLADLEETAAAIPSGGDKPVVDPILYLSSMIMAAMQRASVSGLRLVISPSATSTARRSSAMNTPARDLDHSYRVLSDSEQIARAREAMLSTQPERGALLGKTAS